MTLSRFRGDTFPSKYIIQDASKQPIDITGWTFTMTINSEREPADNTNQIEQISGTIGDPLLGEVSFIFPNTIAPDCYFYDIESTDGAGYVKTWVKGELTIKQDITKV